MVMIRNGYIGFVIAAALGFLRPVGAQESVVVQNGNDAYLLKQEIISMIENQCGDSIRAEVRFSDLSRLFDRTDALPAQVAVLPLMRLHPGKQVVTTEWRDDSGTVTRRHIGIELNLSGSLAFPARLIKRGEVIRPDDVQVREVDLKSFGLNGLVLRPKEVVGLAATRHLSPESPIRWDQLKSPSLVQKGDRVDVLIAADAFAIKTTGTALQTGSFGEKIWVRLEDNGKRMRAVVVDADRVKLK